MDGHPEETFQYHNIHVVYTKEAETADQYIERTVHKIGRKHNVTVATSDGLEQIIIMGAGAHRLSARDLRTEIEHTNGQIRENYLEKEQKTKSYLLENASGELGDFLKELVEERKKESKKRRKKKNRRTPRRQNPPGVREKSRTLTKLFCIRQRYSLKKRVSAMSQLSR